MDIIFATEKLKKLCEVNKSMQKELGEACAKKLRARLSDLCAAGNVSELSAGRPHPLKGDRAGEFAIDLHGGKRLTFEPADNPPPLNEDGSIAWNRVIKVRIVFIGDYHD